MDGAGYMRNRLERELIILNVYLFDFTDRACGDVPDVPDGIVDDGGSHVGALRRISCQGNYTLTGPDYVFCPHSRQWTRPGTCSIGRPTSFFH